MSTDKALLKEVTKDLWQTVKKLRPELDKDTRLQLVLKALLTIGDLPNHIEAAVVVGLCAEMEVDQSSKESSSDKSPSEAKRTVRKRSAANN